MDAAAGHPAWAFQYDSDGNLVSCAVDIGPKTSEKEDIPSDDLGAEAVQFIHIALPQMFTAIITEPPVSVPLLIGPSGAISLATPCGEKVVPDLDTLRLQARRMAPVLDGPFR
ncbi:hypothetical protein QW131_21550 [Roseibium salinum]|nr:hypothetical protein [Roseibium salinum]